MCSSARKCPNTQSGHPCPCPTCSSLAVQAAGSGFHTSDQQPRSASQRGAFEQYDPQRRPNYANADVAAFNALPTGIHPSRQWSLWQDHPGAASSLLGNLDQSAIPSRHPYPTSLDLPNPGPAASSTPYQGQNNLKGSTQPVGHRPVNEGTQPTLRHTPTQKPSGTTSSPAATVYSHQMIGPGPENYYVQQYVGDQTRHVPWAVSKLHDRYVVRQTQQTERETESEDSDSSDEHV